MNENSAAGRVERDSGDDFETQLEKIADQLATLAAAECTPIGVPSSHDAFDPADVSFESGSWLICVLQVQGWLHLDGDVDQDDAESHPMDTAKAIFAAMGAEAPERCVSLDARSARITPEGAEVLSARLDHAVELQEEFRELCESQTRRQATDRWSERWAEVSEDDEDQAGPLEAIKAKTSIWPIQEFADKARKGKLNLSPSYQRGDVWSTDHSQKLIISILRGIPLPSIILLKPRERSAGAAYEVVDGKQRLTSILRFIGKHPAALERVRDAEKAYPEVRFGELFAGNYRKFRRLWTTHMGEKLTAKLESKYYFPFRLPAETSPAQAPLDLVLGKYFHEIKDLSIPGGTEGETVGDVFESVSEYKIPVIEYTEATPRQIHEVFHLYNRQGKHLNAEEIRNALFHEVKLMTLLLAASGDSHEVGRLVPYASDDDRWKLEQIPTVLAEYKFGESRYRRTKLLSWLTAILLHPALQPTGKLAARSTAKQIDGLLARLQKDDEIGARNPLLGTERLRELIGDLHRCLKVHSSCGGWTPKFKDDGDGTKWQELQLVASLVGVFLVCSASENPEDLLEDHTEALLKFTAANPRPVKTQNRSQWEFIGKISLGIAESVGLDIFAVDEALNRRYGVSCIPTLQAAMGDGK